MTPEHLSPTEAERIRTAVDWATWLAVLEGDYP